jgi:hypothetical protein
MKITCTNKAFPDTHVFYVDGLPPLPNGKAVDVSENEAATFEARTGTPLEAALKDNEHIKLTSTAKGDN